MRRGNTKQLLSFRLILYCLVWMSFSFGQAELQQQKTTKPLREYTWSSLSQTLWDPIKKKHISRTMDLHFYCRSSNKAHVFLLSMLEISHPSPIVVKIQTGYIPPSRRGFMQFIYLAEWNEDQKKWAVLQKNQNFLQDIIQLSVQVFRNQEMGKQEYQERIQYCQTLQKPQKCYQSSSGWQPAEPYILLEAGLSKEFDKLYFTFDPRKVNNLQQLQCRS